MGIIRILQRLMQKKIIEIVKENRSRRTLVYGLATIEHILCYYWYWFFVFFRFWPTKRCENFIFESRFGYAQIVNGMNRNVFSMNYTYAVVGDLGKGKFKKSIIGWA